MTDKARHRSDAELLGCDEQAAAAIALTDDERRTLSRLADGIDRAREEARRAGARARTLARQRDSAVEAVKARRFDALLARRDRQEGR